MKPSIILCPYDSVKWFNGQQSNVQSSTGRYCQKNNSQYEFMDFAQLFMEQYEFSLIGAIISNKSVIERVAADITVTWWQILSFFLATAVISLMWIIIMRILGGYMIWTTTFALVIVLAGGLTFISILNFNAFSFYSIIPIYIALNFMRIKSFNFFLQYFIRFNIQLDAIQGFARFGCCKRLFVSA